MSMLTRQDILEKMMAQEKPKCPHCQVEMNIWEVPDFVMGDGLGWGTPYLYVCFNEDCSAYKQGWNTIRDQYSHNASYRCMCYPDTKQFEYIPVFSPQGGTGQIVDKQVIEDQERLKEQIKQGFLVLAECYTNKDTNRLVLMVTDANMPSRVRHKAAEMLGDIGTLDELEPLRNHRFPFELLQKAADDAVTKIHERFYTRECPFCAEIIKQRAQICKHCGKEVAGQ